jgi:large subunit ribosomal protein L35
MAAKNLALPSSRTLWHNVASIPHDGGQRSVPISGSFGELSVAKKYKLKTHKATAKRFRVTGTGILVRTKGGKSHLRRRASKRVKRQFAKMLTVSRADVRKINRLAPYLRKHKANPPRG